MAMDNDQGFERIQTKRYAGRQRWFQDMEHLILERRDKLAKMFTYNSRLIGAMLIVSVLLAVSMLCNVMQWRSGIREVVQVVYMDQLGNERVALRLDQMPATPEQLHVIEALGTWVKMVRTITPAGRIMNDMMDWTKDYTSEALWTRLDGYRKEQRQRQETGIQVHVTKPSIQRLSSPRAYYVEWDECTTSREGRLLVEQSAVWKATILVADFQSQAVKNARDLRIKNKVYRNLSGIVVDEVEWKPQPFVTPQVADTRCAKS